MQMEKLSVWLVIRETSFTTENKELIILVVTEDLEKVEPWYTVYGNVPGYNGILFWKTVQQSENIKHTYHISWAFYF